MVIAVQTPPASRMIIARFAAIGLRAIHAIGLAPPRSELDSLIVSAPHWMSRLRRPAAADPPGRLPGGWLPPDPKLPVLRRCRQSARLGKQWIRDEQQDAHRPSARPHRPSGRIPSAAGLYR